MSLCIPLKLKALICLQLKKENTLESVGVGGLILAKIPEETAEERNACVHEQQTENQMNAVDNNLMRENDPRMPISNERKSKVTFGASGKTINF